jgi:hypothetical protein
MHMCTPFCPVTDPEQGQRDLYVALKDLLIRNDRLSIDQVERLKQRVETTSMKLEGVKAGQKDGWQDEVERYVATIEKDQATIAAQLSRRVFIRAWCISSTSPLSSLGSNSYSACGMSFALCCITEKTHLSARSFRPSPARSKISQRMWRIHGPRFRKRFPICPSSS